MTRKYLTDLAERTAATYIETLTGLLIVGWADFGDVASFLDFGTSAAIAAVPAATVVVRLVTAVTAVTTGAVSAVFTVTGAASQSDHTCGTDRSKGSSPLFVNHSHASVRHRG